jgi:hypothetical protein
MLWAAEFRVWAYGHMVSSEIPGVAYTAVFPSVFQTKRTVTEYSVLFFTSAMPPASGTAVACCWDAGALGADKRKISNHPQHPAFLNF